MALQDWLTNIQFLARWIHVLFGILWIGSLYFLNFAYAPFQSMTTPEARKTVHIGLIVRVLWWFRWGAMVTFAMGLLLFFIIYTYPTTANLLENGHLTSRGIWILTGALIGTFMWFNVWFIVWPAQRKILSSMVQGIAPDQSLLKRASTVSKLNTYLSGPMLAGMLGAGHYSAINTTTAIITLGIALMTIWIFYRTVPFAGQTYFEKTSKL